jgi:hypothetical protein
VDRSRTLRELAACLRGAPPKDCDWAAVLALANQSLVTPGLAAPLQAHSHRVPPQVWTFLEDVRRRNRERNRRLLLQLKDATEALNGAGIQPILLKGAALMVACPRGDAFDRLLSDLDLMVLPAQADDALAALTAAGFATVNRQNGPAVHTVAELGRPQDVGYLDLHQRAPGPPGIADTAQLTARLRVVRIDGGIVQIPDTASQVLHLVLHDQFHDGDYWRGGFDLRHLMDLERLGAALTSDDWRWLHGACQTRLVRAALDAQVFSAKRLFGTAKPAAAASPHSRWTHRRWSLQYARPALRLPLTLLTLVIEWPTLLAHRAANRQGRRRVLGACAPEPFALAGRLARFRKIMAVTSGKI